MLTARQRCIEGEASQGSSSALSFARDSNQAFDIQSMDMVVSSDIDIDVVYLLENGSVCKNTAACSSNGSTLDNPCGAAQALSFHVSPDSSDSTCGLGILEMVLACPDGAPTSSVLTATVVETATTVASVLASSVASIDVAASSSLDALSSSLISVSLPTASSSNLSTSLGSLTPLYLNSTILVLSGTSAAGSCPAESAATSATGLGMSVLASLMTTSSETFISGGVPAAITSAPGQPVSGTNLSTPSFSGTETVSVPSPAPYVGGAAFHKNRSGAQILAGSWIILLAIDI